MNTLLVIHNIGYVFNTLLAILFIIFLFMKDYQRTANKMLILALVAILGYTVSHLIGVNVVDSHLSRIILTFNTSVLFISVFIAHCVFATLGILDKQKKVLIGMYTVSFALLCIYLIFPDTFLLTSSPKLYFPNYYNAGSLYWISDVLSNILIPIYFLYQMVRVYRVSEQKDKNRIKYFFLAFALGYLFGNFAVPLAHDIPIDPVYSIFFFPCFMIPFFYAIYKYELMDIRLVAKKAFRVGIAAALLCGLFTILSFSNQWVGQYVPGFPIWGIPVFSSLASVAIGLFVWKRVREADVLKYEFINVVTHKFRTPLTHIKYAADDLHTTELSSKGKTDLMAIENGVDNLVGLTNMLISLSNTEDEEYLYVFRRHNLAEFVRHTLSLYKNRFTEREIAIDFTAPKPEPFIDIDERRMGFVLQIILDNALTYSPKNSTLSVSLIPHHNSVVLKIQDQGIGISKEDISYVFSKFFRGRRAINTDTEGMGIGLFMAKNIIKRHKGKIWVQSEGPNKGAIFSIELPRK